MAEDEKERLVFDFRVFIKPLVTITIVWVLGQLLTEVLISALSRSSNILGVFIAVVRLVTGGVIITILFSQKDHIVLITEDWLKDQSWVKGKNVRGILQSSFLLISTLLVFPLLVSPFKLLLVTLDILSISFLDTLYAVSLLGFMAYSGYKLYIHIQTPTSGNTSKVLENPPTSQSCPKCHQQAVSNAQFCTKCGTALQ